MNGTLATATYGDGIVLVELPIASTPRRRSSSLEPLGMRWQQFPVPRPPAAWLADNTSMVVPGLLAQVFQSVDFGTRSCVAG